MNLFLLVDCMGVSPVPKQVFISGRTKNRTGTGKSSRLDGRGFALPYTGLEFKSHSLVSQNIKRCEKNLSREAVLLWAFSP